MLLGEINQKTLALVHADTSSYTDANMLIDINMWYQKVVSMIFESQDDTNFDDIRNTTYPIKTTPLVAGQRDYSIPVSEQVLKIKRVDVSYDGTNFYRATPFDNGVPTWGFGNTTNEDANMIKQAPRYGVNYNSIFLYPLPQTTDAIGTGAVMRIEWERAMIPFSQSADYTGAAMSTSTSVPGFDLPFHPILAYGAAYEFANANNLPQLQNIKQDLQDYEGRIRMAYGRKDLDTLYSLRPAYDSYGDYGATGAGGYSYGR